MTKKVGNYDDGKMKIDIDEMAGNSKLSFEGNEIRGWQEIVIVIKRGNLTTVGIKMLPMDNLIQAAIEAEIKKHQGEDEE